MAEKTYNMYKGLQKPLIMFGFKGANIAIVSITLIVIFLLLVIGVNISSFSTGLLMAIVPAVLGWLKLQRNYKEGLHRKKKYYGIWIVKHIIKETK